MLTSLSKDKARHNNKYSPDFIPSIENRMLRRNTMDWSGEPGPPGQCWVFLDLSELKSDKSVARLGNCQVIINKCKSVGSLEEFYHKFWSITSSLGGPFDVAMLGCLSYSNLSSQTCRHHNDSGPGGSQTNNFNSFARILLGPSSWQIFWIFL